MAFVSRLFKSLRRQAVLERKLAISEEALAIQEDAQLELEAASEAIKTMQGGASYEDFEEAVQTVSDAIDHVDEAIRQLRDIGQGDTEGLETCLVEMQGILAKAEATLEEGDQ